MSATIETLKVMDPGHRINALRADFDPLTSTPLEAFLIDWIEELVDEQAAYEPTFKVLDDNNIEDPAELTEFFKVLEEFNCDSPGVLREKLERSDKFYDIANDAGDVFERLNTLVSTTL